MTDAQLPAAANSASGPAFDPKVLDEQTAGDASLNEELIRLCLEQCPVLLGQIRQAVAQRDAAAIRFASHTLKGALMNFGAQRGVTAAQVLEHLAREQQLESIDQAHQELEAAWSELERELNAHLG